MQILSEDHVPRSRIHPELSPNQFAICMKALAKRIVDRFASMNEMAKLLGEPRRRQHREGVPSDSCGIHQCGDVICLSKDPRSHIPIVFHAGYLTRAFACLIMGGCIDSFQVNAFGFAMFIDLVFDETLAQGLPLPLARLYRRAHNAKTVIERHLTAFSLWEAGLKLLASVAIVEYADRNRPNPELAQVLRSLARPSLGHWWEFTRRILPVLADDGDQCFQRLGQLLLGKTRDDMPRAAGLDVALRQALEQGHGGARSSVRLTELFERLVQYRNTVLLGHAAPGQLKESFHARMGAALFAGIAELFGKVDVLAGRRLLYVGEVRQASGLWLVQRFTFLGENLQRLTTLELPAGETAMLPASERLYLDGPGEAAALRALHPLLLYDAEAEEVLFLNSRRGKKRLEYLCYTSGRTAEKPDLGSEQRELLANALGMTVSEKQAMDWADLLQDQELPGEGEEVSGKGRSSQTRRMLGEFELLSELGKGAMGIVYRAWQPSLGRQVALKKLLTVGDAKTEARFRREIKALGHVEHPHVVKVYTSGSDGDQWFYAMELVEGAPLSAVCDRLSASASGVGPLDRKTWQETVSTVCEAARRAEKPLARVPEPAPEMADHANARSGGNGAPRPPPAAHLGRTYGRQVAELVRQIAEAAHALHEKGIVHRDIKPGNIMVAADGNHAVLMDLGLAQLADDEEGRLTRTRQFVGTLRYASPEQVLAVAPLDARSDVYSLGATLWELLTLQPLFGATEQTPVPEVMQRIQYQEAERVRKYNPAVPRDLAAIVEKCLQKEAHRRYRTAHELGEDLGRFLEGRLTQARPVKQLERTYRWVHRYPARATVLALVLLVAFLAGIGGVVTSLWLDADTAKQEADSARLEAETAFKKEAAARLELEITQKDLMVETKAKEEALQKLYGRSSYLDQVVLAWTKWHTKNGFEARAHLLACPEKQRNMEWYHLQHLLAPELATLEGHQAIIIHVAFSPDSNLLATASVNGVIKLWNVHTGECLRDLRGHAGVVRGVAFSRDGRRLVSGGMDKTVKVWEVGTGKLPLDLKGHRGLVVGVAFGPQPDSVYSIGSDGMMLVWNGANHTSLQLQTPKPGDAIRFSAFSQDCQQVAAGTSAGELTVWETATGRRLHSWPGHANRVTEPVFTPDGQRLASTDVNGNVKLWDLQTGKEIPQRAALKERVDHLAFSPDVQWMASTGPEKVIKLWEVATGEEIASLVGQRGLVTHLLYSPDGQRLASASADGTVKMWDSQPGKGTATLAGHKEQITHIAFSPDGRCLASSSRDKLIKLWDPHTASVIRTLTGHLDEVRCVTFSPNGLQMASASRDKTLKLWNVQTGQEEFSLRGHKDSVSHAAYRRDGRQVASASWDNTIKLWDTQTGKLTATLEGHTGTVAHVAYRPDNLQLASASWDNTVRLWDVPSQQEFKKLQGHSQRVLCIAYSPDGKQLASASMDSTIKLWDTRTGQHIKTMREHTGPVQYLTYDANGKFLASAGGDGFVKIWDVENGKEASTLIGHSDWVLHVAFSPDGERLVSADRNGVVMLWDAQLGKQITTLGKHGAAAVSVEFNPNGQQIASAGGDNVIKMWYGKVDNENWEKRKAAMRQDLELKRGK